MPEERASPNYEAETLRQLHCLVEENHQLLIERQEAYALLERYHAQTTLLLHRWDTGTDPTTTVATLRKLQERGAELLTHLVKEAGKS